MVICLKSEFQPSKHFKLRNEICIKRQKMCWEVPKRAETIRKDYVSCVPPKVMLGAGHKDDMSYSWELDSRYDYLGASRTLMFDA